MTKSKKSGPAHWSSPLRDLYSAIEFENLEVARSVLDGGFDVSADVDFPNARGPEDDLEFSDPLVRCCRHLCLLAGDGGRREKASQWLAIAHLLIDRGASLLRPDTSLNITAMEELVVLEVDDESILDQECLQDIAALWSRMDENPPGGAEPARPDGGSMMERTRKLIPGFARVPRQLTDIMEAISQERQMLEQVDQPVKLDGVQTLKRRL